MAEMLIQGPQGRIEARYTPPPYEGASIALILHPHPRAGGSMQDPITIRLYQMFEEKGFDLEEVAEIREETSGRSLKISTTEPGMLFYTGKYTSDELQRESGLQYGKFRGFCCETHRYPNGPNFPDSPKSILRKDETYESTTIFQFEW